MEFCVLLSMPGGPVLFILYFYRRRHRCLIPVLVSSCLKHIEHDLITSGKRIASVVRASSPWGIYMYLKIFQANIESRPKVNYYFLRYQVLHESCAKLDQDGFSV